MKSIPHVVPSDDPLVGRAFAIVAEGDIEPDTQIGYVRAALPGGHYMVQFIDTPEGRGRALAVVHLSEMRFDGAVPGHSGRWIFFEDRRQLGEWLRAEGITPRAGSAASAPDPLPANTTVIAARIAGE